MFTLVSSPSNRQRRRTTQLFSVSFPPMPPLHSPPLPRAFSPCIHSPPLIHSWSSTTLMSTSAKSLRDLYANLLHNAITNSLSPPLLFLCPFLLLLLPSSPFPSPPLPSPPFLSYTHAVHMHYPTTTNGHRHHLPLPCHTHWHHD